VRSAGDDVRRLMAAYRDKSDLIAIGAYQRGSDPLTDAAIDARDPIDGFLRQGVEEVTSAAEADAALTRLALLAGVPEPAPGQPAVAAEPPPAQPGTPLHAAIPPLHLAA
jgi:flagellum-specific ATP synthase